MKKPLSAGRTPAANPNPDDALFPEPDNTASAVSMENTAKAARIPFTNNMESVLYARWVRYAHHTHSSLQEVFEDALNAYLADHRLHVADQPMKPSAEAKLQKKLSPTPKGKK